GRLELRMKPERLFDVALRAFGDEQRQRHDGGKDRPGWAAMPAGRNRPILGCTTPRQALPEEKASMRVRIAILTCLLMASLPLPCMGEAASARVAFLGVAPPA